DDLVEKIGVEKAKAYADEADLIIFVVDSSKPLDENDADIINIVKEKKVISLLNKSDLESVVNKEDLEKLLDGPVINISALENTGIEELSNEIKKMFYENKISYNNQIYITNARHKALLSDSLESLRLVEKSIEDNMPEDFFSIDLMNAYESLGLIIGEAVEDDLVEEIFSKFCMGK
nr:tRNA uridine-5-carboxymethylaminomethyl(34) synthesis GTPase MnmE [Parasporobacterium sp.]